MDVLSPTRPVTERMKEKISIIKFNLKQKLDADTYWTILTTHSYNPASLS